MHRMMIKTKIPEISDQSPGLKQKYFNFFFSMTCGFHKLNNMMVALLKETAVQDKTEPD